MNPLARYELWQKVFIAALTGSVDLDSAADSILVDAERIADAALLLLEPLKETAERLYWEQVEVERRNRT